MFLQSLFQWWYTNGWASKWRNILTKSSEQAEAFSLGIILKTLFKPWKQMTALDAHGGMVQRGLDSLISRFVGFWIRLFVLFGGVVFILISLIINIITAIVWPFIPLAPIIFLVISSGLS